MAEKNLLIEQLEKMAVNENENWQRISFVLRKHMDIWAHNYFRPIWSEVKLSYMPILFNISLQGSTASEIAKGCMLPKQTVSRTIKELEDKKLIESNTSALDKRIEFLTLTEKGMEFVLNAKAETYKLKQKYANLVGIENLVIAEKVVNDIIAYHESMEIETHTLQE